MSAEFLKNFYDYEVPVSGVKYPGGTDAKSDLKLLLQIATCSHLKQGQDKKNSNKQIFYCKNAGKDCMKIQVEFNKEGQFEILGDYRNFNHAKCGIKMNPKIIQIYNLMMLKRDEIQKFMIKYGLFDQSPEVILQNISGETGDYFYYKAVPDMESRRKLKKRFDNIINITIKKKRELKLKHQMEIRKQQAEAYRKTFGYVKIYEQPQVYQTKGSQNKQNMYDQQGLKLKKKLNKKKTRKQNQENYIPSTMMVKKELSYPHEKVKNLISHKRMDESFNYRNSAKQQRILREIDWNKTAKFAGRLRSRKGIVSNNSILYHESEHEDDISQKSLGQNEIYEQNDDIMFKNQRNDDYYFQRNSNVNLGGINRFVDEPKSDNYWTGSNQSIGEFGFGDEKLKYQQMCYSFPIHALNKSLQRKSLIQFDNQVQECIQQNTQYLKPNMYIRPNQFKRREQRRH